MNYINKLIMDEILENKIVYTNLNDKYIIKCECLDILIYYFKDKIYNIDFAKYWCDKVRIIELYDINKNIIDHIIDPIYNDPLKRGSIISLESFKEDVVEKKKYYFKTFLRAYIEENKINDIKYCILDTGQICNFKNDNVEFKCFGDLFKFNEFDYYIQYYNNNEIIYGIDSNYNYFDITYFLYNKSYNYKIEIYRNKIIIKKIHKALDFFSHQQIITCNKELKILKVLERNNNNVLYEENRDINDNIIDIKKYNSNTDKLETIISNNDNNNNNNKIILIESEKSFPQELLDFYKSKINYCIDNLIPIKNYELSNAKNVLLNKIFKEL